MTRTKLAVMSQEEAVVVCGRVEADELKCYPMENPFNPPYWVVLINTPTGIRCVTSMLQAEWFLEGLKATKRARV
jgi:hypothetical protein